VTQLRKKVLEELKRRNYSQTTAHAYVAAIRRFAEYFHRSPDQLGIEHVREYQLYLTQERKLRPKSLQVQMAALRFLFLKVLKRRWSRDYLPLPKCIRRQVPVVKERMVIRIREGKGRKDREVPTECRCMPVTWQMLGLATEQRC
jgi:hypothetical protein